MSKFKRMQTTFLSALLFQALKSYVIALILIACIGSPFTHKAKATEDITGRSFIVLGHENFDDGVQFSPMPEIFLSLTKKHPANYWQSTTANASFEAINIYGDTMFERGTGLLPREMSLLLNKIGPGGCTDLELGLRESLFFANGSQSWHEMFHTFSTPAVTEDIPYEIGLQEVSMFGAGLTQRLNCQKEDPPILELETFYRSPSFLRKIYGQNVTPFEGRAADSPTPSFRVGMNDNKQISEHTKLRYGFNLVYLQAGEDDGIEITPEQPSLTAFAAHDYQSEKGTKLKIFLEGGYVENTSSRFLHGPSNISGSYINASFLATHPIDKNLFLTFSTYSVKMPSKNTFFGKYTAGAEIGFEWKFYNHDNVTLGLAAKKGGYNVWEGDQEGWRNVEQALFKISKNF